MIKPHSLSQKERQLINLKRNARKPNNNIKRYQIEQAEEELAAMRGKPIKERPWTKHRTEQMIEAVLGVV